MQEATREGQIQEALRSNPEIMTGKSEEAVPMTDVPADKDGGMTVKTLSQAGIVKVWDTKTFKEVPILYYMLPAKMRERRPDGSYRFTTNKPTQEPYKGKIKCMFNKDDPNYEHYKELGIRECKKGNLANPYERDRHMKLKHPREWETVENERKEKERAEDRIVQQEIFKQIKNNITPTQPVIETGVPAPVSPYICDVCAKTFKNALGLAGHKTSHK